MTEHRVTHESWYCWHLYPDIPALTYQPDGWGPYRIDLDRILDSADLVFWIFQIRDKPWLPGHLTGFLNAVDDVLNPQQSMGAFDGPRAFTSESIRDQVAGYLRDHPTAFLTE